MFTVCIPSFNHRPYLTAAVLSALRSPLVTEVLVVDDGSSDGSAALLAWLQRMGPRLRVLPSAGNRGAHARLNELVDAAAAEWVAVLNSDDCFVAGRFEAIERVANRGQADLIFGDLILIDGHGKRIGQRHAIHHNEIPWPPRWNMDRMVRDGQWAPVLCLQNIMATTTNMVFTKSLHRALGGFRDYRYCHDWDFALRAALTARLHYAPAMLSQYRLHDSNTIKEAADRVRHEVRRMLVTVAADVPMLQTPALATVLAANHYMRPPGSAVLAIILADPVAAGLLAQEVAAAALPVTIGAAAPSGLEPYVYAPGPAGTAALNVQDIRAILLVLATARYDALLLTRTGDGVVSEGGLNDALVLRRPAAGTWRVGAVRTVRLYPRALDAEAGDPIVITMQEPGPGIDVPMPAPFIADPRPVVFVLPAFLALGGVERLVITTLNALQDRWRFVVVTTEPLRPEQGTTHHEVLATSPVYDLAELADPARRIAALATLRDWYNPALVWIMNGAPWQVDHATDIRAVFRGVPIVDHQAYDHQAGWVNRLGDPGVRDADRFVAINQKIARVMQDRHGIDARRIDLIYHGADMSRTVRRELTSDHVAQRRISFGLDPARPVFGMIGRLSAQKRPRDLAALARRVGPRVQFVWVGPGELEAELRANAPDNFLLIPAQADLVPVYEALDGLVITSEFEGLPIVLIEALAMGVPALSTDVGAIGEVLARYGSGMTWGEPGDIDALEVAFKAFRRALPGLRAAAVTAAGQVREDFSSNRMAQEYEASWRRAIAGLDGPALEPARPIDPPNGAERQDRNGRHARYRDNKRPPALGSQLA